MNSRTFDVVVIGGGAAGLMAAMRAGQRGRRVLLLDHAEKVGKKILISGGGRCNFTNTGAAPERFISANPHFCKSALARYTQHDFIALVDKHGIAWHEKTLGQLFCDGSARQIVAMLLAECAAVGVDVRVAHRVTNIERSDRFRVTTDQGAFEATAVVLATGGLSVPKMGASGFAHDWARRFGLKMTQTRPGLVPLTLKVPDIAGVSFDVVARFGKVSFREAMLFTHRGLSGPAILQISSYWKAGQEIGIDLLPDLDASRFLKERRHARPKAEPRTILAFDVASSGDRVSNRRLLIDSGPHGTPDGFRVDIDGNLWCGWGMGSAELDGVRIFNPRGEPIGHIALPERCANVCFGGPKRNRLFMAASHSVYALYVNTQGALGG